MKISSMSPAFARASAGMLCLCGFLLSSCASAPQGDPAKARAYVAEGREAAKRGDHAKAVDLCSRAIEEDPQLSEAWYSRGYSHVQLRLSPESPDFARGYEDRAIGDYSQAIQINPGYGDAYYNRAMVFSSRALYRQAAEDLLNAIKYKEQDPEPHLDLARLYEQKFEDMGLQADEHYVKYVDLGGRDRDARERARRIKEQKKLAASMPKVPAPEDETKAQEIDARVMQLFKDGKKDEAVKLVEELLTTYARTKYVQGKIVALKALQSAYMKDVPK
jgi:tetratricopeptide (TPR) repeat protein